MRYSKFSPLLMCATGFKHKHPVLIVLVLNRLLMHTQSDVIHKSNIMYMCFPFDSDKKQTFYPVELSLNESFIGSEMCSTWNEFCLCKYITLILVFRRLQYTTCTYSTLHAHTVHYMRIQYTTCTYSTLHVHTIHYMRIMYTTCAYSTLHAHTVHYMHINPL